MPRKMTREEYNEHMRVYILERYHRRMAEARTFLGGKCVVCGGVEDLQLHHKDPATKSGTVARIWSWSEERFWSEVKKCELRCKKCHRYEHRSRAIMARSLGTNVVVIAASA